MNSGSNLYQRTFSTVFLVTGLIPFVLKELADFLYFRVMMNNDNFMKCFSNEHYGQLLLPYLSGLYLKDSDRIESDRQVHEGRSLDVVLSFLSG